jgi:hypothetical protein
LEQRLLSLLPPRNKRRRVGKVAGLPLEWRDWVSQQIHAEVPYREIMAALAEVGFTAFNKDNLKNWKKGGYGDWLLKQQDAVEIEARRTFATQLVREKEGQIEEVAMMVGASQLSDALTRFDVRRLDQLLDEKPETYLKALGTLGRLGEARRAFRKKPAGSLQGRLAGSLGEAELLPNKTGGLTPEVLRQMEEAINLM